MPEKPKQTEPALAGVDRAELLAEPFCSTKRFNVFKSVVPRPEELGCERMVFQAWFHSDDVPYPVCLVTVNEANFFMDNYVDWISTHELYRRQGIATEVLEAIRSKIGDIEIDGVTDEGKAFQKSFM